MVPGEGGTWSTPWLRRCSSGTSWSATRSPPCSPPPRCEFRV